MVPAVRYTVYLTMTTQTDTTHASQGQEERFVFMDGMDSAVRYTVFQGMTRWRVIIAIPRDKKIVCITGMAKINVLFIANRPTILRLATCVTQMETGCVYKAGMDLHAIAKQGTTLPWVTPVILQPEEESALRDGSATIVTFSVPQEMIQQVIAFATVALELKSVCSTGMEKTVLFTANPGIILLVSTSAL